MRYIALKTKTVLLSITLAVVIFVATFLGGCTLFDFGDYYAEFTKSRLNLSIGDRYDLSSIIKSNGPDYDIVSSDTRVAGVYNTTVVAYSAGSATLTLTSEVGASTLRVVVAEESIAIEADGDLIQEVGQLSDITFKVNASGSVADGIINWYENDVRKARKTASASYTFKPTAAGTTVITAKSAANPDCSDSVTVRAYYPVSASGTADGELEQTGNVFTPITLSVDAETNSHNPDNYIEWRVDGTAVYGGAEASYSYMPTAGRHTVELYVNGSKRKINGEDEISVACSGSVIPKNIEVIFDNMYPHLYIRADVDGDMQVEITSPYGKTETFNKKTNPQLFDENGFDAASKMALCASGGIQAAYGIRVKSLGDGDLLYESEYSDVYSFKQLPALAKQYIENIYHNKDHYITSDEEYVNAFEYYVVSRPKTNSKTHRIKFECYVGYNMTYTADQLWNYAFRIGATSGSYSGRGAWLSSGNKVLNTEMYVNTVNNPTRQTYKGSTSKYSTQLHASLPHINYDEDKYRPDDYVFPIDALSRTASVRYTDELYLASQNGTRPVPVAGSAAETVYEMARNILRQIISEDMTDKQKAHAIYDWIMWQVTYDKPATLVTNDGESLSSYYLEGVFGDGVTPIGGVVYYPYAVCDGMSKAYSLMCNIEGIPCVRVSGMAGSKPSAAGGHAWNKVYIDGAWYIVDCTWGDAVSSRTINGVTADYEFGLHDWLFVTDDTAESTHYEPYTFERYSRDWGECEIVYAPRTATKPLSPYTDMIFNGVEINCEVASGENQKTRVAQIMKAFAGAYQKKSSIYVPGRGDGNYSVDYQSVEIHFEDGCSISSMTLSAQIRTAVMTVLPRARVEVFSYDDNTVFVLVKA